MGSDLKEMKYRRRIGMEDLPQRRDPRAVDWVALQQDPVELLRKLDELREQITWSCHVVGPPQEHRRVSRRAVSLIPEPPPLTGYHCSRYGGRYGHGLPPGPYSPARSEHEERYMRQSSGHYWQFPGRQWENGGISPGSYHHYSCACPHCLYAQRAPPQEENIPMAKYFAGQHESYRFERSPSVSSDYDRRSVASSLYSHRSVSKRRAEYFRKKAEHHCRPVDGAAPFVVCSSCYQLLQMPMEKCIVRKQNQLQCGSCCQIVSLKHEGEKDTPFTQSASLYGPEMEQISSGQMRRDPAHQHHHDFNSMYYCSNEHNSMQINPDFADDNSFSSTVSRSRTEKECGSSRSIQSKADDLSFSPSRSVDVGSPKDILCERDADCKVESSIDCPISLHSPMLEDKLVDPLCTQEKDNNGEEDEGLASRLELTSKSECHVNDSESLSIGGKQKGTEGDSDAIVDESLCKNHEQKGKEDKCCNPEDGSNMYEQDSGKDGTGGLEEGGEKFEMTNKVCDSTNVEHTSKEDEQKSDGAERCVLEAESISNNGENHKEDVSGTLESTSRTERCEELKVEEDDRKAEQPFVEDASSLEGSGSSVNGRTNSGFSRGSSETGLDEDQSSTGKSGDSSFFAGFLKKGFKDLSLFNQPMDNVKVSINGHPISERALKKAEKKAGPVEPGSYW
jgi:hypothetical protein